MLTLMIPPLESGLKRLLGPMRCCQILSSDLAMTVLARPVWADRVLAPQPRICSGEVLEISLMRSSVVVEAHRLVEAVVDAGRAARRAVRTWKSSVT
jgi:hypothetical protein